MTTKSDAQTAADAYDSLRLEIAQDVQGCRRQITDARDAFDFSAALFSETETRYSGPNGLRAAMQAADRLAVAARDVSARLASNAAKLQTALHNRMLAETEA